MEKISFLLQFVKLKTVEPPPEEKEIFYVKNQDLLKNSNELKYNLPLLKNKKEQPAGLANGIKYNNPRPGKKPLELYAENPKDKKVGSMLGFSEPNNSPYDKQPR